MNIEEGVMKAKAILDNHREIDKMMVIDMVDLVETLLTAYEKEKEKAEYENELRIKYQKRYDSVKEKFEKEKEKNKPYPDCTEPIERTEEMVNMKWVNYKYVSKDKIKSEIEELKNMKVDGEVFKTSVNFAIKVLQSLLEKE